MYALYTSPTSNAVIRKINTDGSLTWMASFAVYPFQKSMPIDSSEQNVYFAYMTCLITVFRLSTSTGISVSQQIM